MSWHDPAPMLHRSTIRRRSLAATVLGLALGACASAAPSPPPPTVAAPVSRDSVTVRHEATAERDEAARRAAEETAAIEAAEAAFAACRDEGLLLERSARDTGTIGQYKRAALILEGCLDEAGRSGVIPAEERMPVMALAIQGHAKAGDVARARELLGGFETTFAGLDLYFTDGTSFIESAGLALGKAADTEAGVFSTANVNPVLKADLRRQRYWQDK